MTPNKVSITITGAEALEDLKKFFPKTWGDYIQTGKETIHSMMRIYNLPAIEAVSKACTQTGGFKDPNIIIASLYIMLKQQRISTDLKKLEDEITQTITQSVALENSKNFNSKESGELRKFYSDKQNELQKKFNELINEFPVIEPKIIKAGQFSSN